MKLKKSLGLPAVILLIIMAQACSTPKKSSVFWVSGIKTECSAGAGKMNCLNVYRGDDLANSKWELFYAPIEGFQFEEGIMKKIEVNEEKLDGKPQPADASSIKYTLVKELEKQPDTRLLVSGNWIPSRINGSPIASPAAIPTMEVQLNSMQIAGSGGCNMYSGPIKKMMLGSIVLGNIVATQRACINDNVETAYFNALNATKLYKVSGSELIFFDESGKETLYFTKAKTSANQRLHDLWVAVQVDGNPINRMATPPRMEINLTEMKVMGSDGCNNYTGGIKEASDTALSFAPLASTKKMCPKMELANSFNKAMTKVATYKLEGLKLILMDKEGKEVLQFLKTD